MAQRVLVVDDQPELRKIVCLFLEQYFEVDIYEAEDGMSALHALESIDRLDLIITDLNMPNLNGIEMVKKIRQKPRWEKLPILMLTSEADSFKQSAIDAGVNHFFNKPLLPANLMPEISKILNNPNQ